MSPAKDPPEADGYVLNVVDSRRALLRDAVLERRMFKEPSLSFRIGVATRLSVVVALRTEPSRISGWEGVGTSPPKACGD
jgi:hypothetical protein